MDFVSAWSRIDIGEMVVVRNGQPEPTIIGSLDWKIWSSWNFTGELMEKIQADTQILRFQVLVEDLAVLNYEVANLDNYTFERVTPLLTDEKEKRIKEVDIIWRSILNNVCISSFGHIDSSEESRLFVAGAVTMATIALANNQSFNIRWRMKDNSYANLDGPGMVQLGVELGTFVNLCCQARFNAKDAVTSAVSLQELTAIDIVGFFNNLI